MGQAKKMMMEKEQSKHYEGSSGSVAFSGGYLDIKIDGKTIATVSVPAPDFTAERSRDSIVSWDEQFQDNEGNDYDVTVHSSIYGVEWEIDIKVDETSCQASEKILHDIKDRINITLHLNEDN